MYLFRLYYLKVFLEGIKYAMDQKRRSEDWHKQQANATSSP